MENLQTDLQQGLLDEDKSLENDMKDENDVTDVADVKLNGGKKKRKFKSKKNTKKFKGKKAKGKKAKTTKKKGSKKRGASKWIKHVISYAEKHNITFPEALKNAACKAEYKKL